MSKDHPDWTYPEGYNLSSFDRMLERDPEPYGLDPALLVLEDETGAELTPTEFDEAISLSEQEAAYKTIELDELLEVISTFLYIRMFGRFSPLPEAA